MSHDLTPLPPWMVAEDVVLPGGAGNMGVDFGSGDVFMAKHFLD